MDSPSPSVVDIRLSATRTTVVTFQAETPIRGMILRPRIPRQTSSFVSTPSRPTSARGTSRPSPSPQASTVPRRRQPRIKQTARMSTGGTAPKKTLACKGGFPDSPKKAQPQKPKKEVRAVEHGRVTRLSEARKREQHLENFKKATTDSLTCSICTDIVYRPTMISPCAHKFCSSCLSQMFAVPLEEGQAAHSCPNCRGEIWAVSKDAQTGQLLENFLCAFPDLKPDQKMA
ncbi:hypothetical protein QR680_012093 [Steinernema hermaphroditum]|uniref:RING-type domain-containing protein n=1 Tax=Steinernema hermaphroditum TaxID=289476 RepID=A0AA39I2G6_9BILA|nr:hypothetical protein QR680_012093 [Steinernema hermaphroditum]